MFCRYPINRVLLILAATLSACGGGGSSSEGRDAPSTDVMQEQAQVQPDTRPVISEFNPDWPATGAHASAASCGNCHRGATDGSGVMRLPATSAGEDISPYAGWQHSTMAHAFNDPYFRAKMEDELIEFPGLAGTIEDKCLTCHTPMARNHAHATGMLSTDACLAEEGCYRLEQAENSMMARESVSCTLCHQIDPDNLDESSHSGKFTIDTDAREIYGPYLDPRRGPMLNATGYEAVHSPHIQSSEVCATCHDLDTPSIDVVTGELTGRDFVEQAPYREWRNSRYSAEGAERHCQDCHLPQVEGYETAIAVNPMGFQAPGWPQRDDYSEHAFRGGNVYLLELMRDYREELGVSESTTEEGFNKAIASNEAFLATEAARLTVSTVDIADGHLSVDVSIANLTGHKLPTSFPSRRMWLNLIVRDSAGNQLFASGTPDSQGMLAMDASLASPACVNLEQLDETAQCFSPHRNMIRQASQVPVYESVMGDTLGRVAHVLLYGDSYLKDNRIPPVGFTTAAEAYNPAIAIVGEALADPDFNRDQNGEGSGSDVVHYRLDWSGMAGSGLEVEAILYYQSVRPSFALGLQHSGSHIDWFRDMYAARKPRPLVLAKASVSYP